jgi:hypothetical protein
MANTADIPSTLIRLSMHLIRSLLCLWREKSIIRPASPAAIDVATDVAVTRSFVDRGIMTASPRTAKFLVLIVWGAGFIEEETLARPSV